MSPRSLEFNTRTLLNFPYADLEAQRTFEDSLALTNYHAYYYFAEDMEKKKRKYLNILNYMKQDGKKIICYGASTKGSIFLQWLGLTHRDIPYAADRNPTKVGTFCSGTGIEVISEEQMRTMKPDVLLVLPWHFKDEFVKREIDLINQGTEMLFFLPEIESVSRAS
jgi:hypothetical protein